MTPNSEKFCTKSNNYLYILYTLLQSATSAYRTTIESQKAASGLDIHLTKSGVWT